MIPAMHFDKIIILFSERMSQPFSGPRIKTNTLVKLMKIILTSFAKIILDICSLPFQ